MNRRSFVKSAVAASIAAILFVIFIDVMVNDYGIWVFIVDPTTGDYLKGVCWQW